MLPCEALNTYTINPFCGFSFLNTFVNTFLNIFYKSYYNYNNSSALFQLTIVPFIQFLFYAYCTILVVSVEYLYYVVYNEE